MKLTSGLNLARQGRTKCRTIFEADLTLSSGFQVSWLGSLAFHDLEVPHTEGTDWKGKGVRNVGPFLKLTSGLNLARQGRTKCRTIFEADLTLSSGFQVSWLGSLAFHDLEVPHTEGARAYEMSDHF